MIETFHCALRELTRHKGRAIFNIAGHVLATALIVLLGHVVFFTKEAEDAVLLRTGTHFIAFSPGCRGGGSFTPPEISMRSSEDIPLSCKSGIDECRSCAKKPLDPANEAFVANTVVTGLQPLECVDAIRKLPTVKDASPFLLFRFKHHSDGHLFSVGGFDPGNSLSVYTTCCSPKHVISGVFLKNGEKGNALLEEAYAVQNSLKVNDNIVIAGFAFNIVGIVRPGARPAKADVYLTFDDAQMAINKRIQKPLSHEVNIILIEAAASNQVDAAIKEVKQNLVSGVVTSFACSIPSVKAFGMNRESALLLIIFICLGSIALSIKSQLASVSERKHDIGILIALGWRNQDVVRQIFLESHLQALLGGALGLLLSSATILLVPIKQISGIDTQIELSLYPTLFAAGFILNLLASSIAATIPAVKAARINPLEALRLV